MLLKDKNSIISGAANGIGKESAEIFAKNGSNLLLLDIDNNLVDISNFMLLQLSYSELFFSDINWPDFSFSHFEQALKSFSNRKRRFGSGKNHKSGQRKITSF